MKAIKKLSNTLIGAACLTAVFPLVALGGLMCLVSKGKVTTREFV